MAKAFGPIVRTLYDNFDARTLFSVFISTKATLRTSAPTLDLSEQPRRQLTTGEMHSPIYRLLI